jgi:SM-20-related protein
MDLFNAPPAFLQINNWLGPETVARFLAYAIEHRSEFKPSGVITPEGACIDPDRRVSEKLVPVPEIAREIAAHLKQALPDIFAALSAAPFTPRYEIELVAHGDGAHYKLHQDVRPGVQRDRTISGVYYFNRQPKAFSGGQLRLHALSESLKPGAFADIEPENDSVVFFPSWFPHEVLPVSCPSGEFMDARFAVNCWLHR